MGLDMYAYSVHKDLVGDDQVDIPLTERAFAKVGFVAPSEEDLNTATDDQLRAFWRARDEAYEKTRSEGWIDRDFAYWRKFNHLHGWMHQLYEAKGGTDPNFNCNTVRLMPEDLDRLAAMASMKALAPTSGFFFGANEPFNEDDKAEVLDFVAKAREAIKDGRAIVYDSWW